MASQAEVQVQPGAALPVLAIAGAMVSTYAGAAFAKKRLDDNRSEQALWAEATDPVRRS